MATFNGTTLNDTLIGSALSDLLYGLAGNDSLSGGALGEGNDTLDGGTGSDTLDGGIGDDTYVVDSTKDVIVETGGDADDIVQASITIDLNSAAYDGIEHVMLTGTGALNATGDDAGNVLLGNGGANKLDGRGGQDSMAGGAGNDTYEVDSDGDFIVELSGGGTDQVNSSFSFTLANFIENLTLTGSSDSLGNGNDLANKITGNDASNPLDGGDGNDTLTGNGGDDDMTGGNGADSLVGGAGSDRYEVDDVGDKIAESGPAGDFDSVDSAITYTLGANLEILRLVGFEDIDGTGNSLNNVITGNFNANVLSGLAGNDTVNGNDGDDLLLGGDGNDELQGLSNASLLVGGAGNDVFKFFASSGTDEDTVADLNGLPGGDLIDVSDLLGSSGVTPATIGQFLQAVSSGGSTLLRIDTNGGANSFVDLAVLQGVSTDLNGLVANAAIVGAGTLTATTITGLAGADTLAAGATSQLVQGLAGNDSLSGGAGFDTLDGGTGTDTLAGGAASDTYIVDSTKDVIIESGGTDDRIQASITIDLNSVTYDGIEHVTLSGTGAINATGDDGANMLIGNTGANKLDGRGGNDTAIGGGGNDTYEVDSDKDAIVEYANEGTDQVNSAAISFALAGFVENLTLTGTADSAGIGNALGNKITGNAGANDLQGDLGNDTLTGNDGADFLDGGEGADSMVGGKGGDEYFVDDVGDKISETGPSTEIDTVSCTISYVLGSTIENLDVGGGSIDGTGNALANVIDGSVGDNVLSGLAGNDTIDGSAGHDLLLGGDGNDRLSSTGDGNDTLVGGGGNDVFRLSNPIFLQFTPTSPSTIVDFNGVPGGDVIDLEAVLPSGVTAATAAGFLKTDTVGGSTTLLVDEDGGANGFVAKGQLLGVSTDLAGLLANGSILGIDNLVPTPVIGAAGADTLAAAATSTLVQGLGGNDSLTGGNGFDTLDGGTGTDTLIGGKGSDTYIVDSAKDVITELGADADDRIQSSITIDLNAAVYAGIEHVTLTGTGAINATGDGDANMLVGNAGANKLDGGIGNDTTIGGAGNDTYEVNATNDLIIEHAGEGTDQVNSSASYELGDYVENLTLTGISGISGNGNDLGNKITGNAGDNFLSGNDGNDTLTGNDGADQLAGGGGADSMTGGNGDDTYYFDDIGDKIAETGANGGTDRVAASLTYTLGANLENLLQIGSGDVDGTGNSLANAIDGNAGNNVLSGLLGNDTLAGFEGDDQLLGGDGADLLRAGAGADTLAGGAGSDRFVLDATSLDGLDLIIDFNGLPGGDLIDLSDLLAAFNPAVNNINNFLRTTIEDGATFLQVDQDGAAGGANFDDVAVIVGVTTDVLGLLNNGSLVLAD